MTAVFHWTGTVDCFIDESAMAADYCGAAVHKNHAVRPSFDIVKCKNDGFMILLRPTVNIEYKLGLRYKIRISNIWNIRRGPYLGYLC